MEVFGSPKFCNARVHTDADCTVVVNSFGEHTHEGNQQKMETKLLQSRCKRKCEDDLLARPSTVILKELQDHNHSPKVKNRELQTMTLQDPCMKPPTAVEQQLAAMEHTSNIRKVVKNTKLCMYRARRNLWQKLHRNLQATTDLVSF